MGAVKFGNNLYSQRGFQNQSACALSGKGGSNSGMEQLPHAEMSVERFFLGAFVFLLLFQLPTQHGAGFSCGQFRRLGNGELLV